MTRRAIATLRTAADLIEHGLAPSENLSELDKVAARYAVAVTPDVAALIDASDPNDPIARQYVPSADELVTHPIENADPIGDHTHSPVSGIVHRYPDRVLFKLVHVCAVYCRFCFRREMVGPGKETALSDDVYSKALDYIRAHSEIWEVILTGGDPLMLSARRLKEIMADLAAIDHVKIIRIHTRVPVADPARVTDETVDALKAMGATTWVALHANHPRELTGDARTACARIIDAGIPMVSQSVLLRGVNDNAATLEALMRSFVECRIKPYYLHHGDLAPGTAHLRTTLEEGQKLMLSLRGRVSGLCQPDYVLDIPGGHGKAPIGPQYLSQAGEDGHDRRYRVVDYCGDVHLYPPAEQMTKPEPPENDGHRGVENAVMLGFFVVLVTAGIWLLGLMADIRKTQDCAAQGRRNCATIENPSHSRQTTPTLRNRYWWRCDMRKSIPIAMMALLLAASGAMAQSKSGTTTGPSATTSSGSVPPAPVGHRQPRASDVPSNQEKNYTESAEDKALDRKIKSICRGC